MSRITNQTAAVKQNRAQQFPEQLNAGRLTVMRSAHTTRTNVYPMARAFVVTKDGATLVAGRDATERGVNALHRHAQAAEREATPRPTWRDRRAA